MIFLLAILLAVGAAFELRHRHRRDRADARLVRDYLEAHSFPGDSIADVLTEHGDVTLAEVRRVSEAYQAGFRDGEAHARRYPTRKASR
jgi:hypothetical protein